MLAEGVDTEDTNGNDGQEHERQHRLQEGEGLMAIHTGFRVKANGGRSEMCAVAEEDEVLEIPRARERGHLWIGRDEPDDD